MKIGKFYIIREEVLANPHLKMVDAIVPAVELLPDDADDNEASNYVFQIEEFENDSFNASNFFVKYKAVYGCKLCIVMTVVCSAKLFMRLCLNDLL